ncbi:hypothetical protein [Halocatena halophila]|uniref:hypothetical protein n=1 Tax=Halocatena halophila TaxID=2814576 RepID=UPI002ED0072A
MSKSRCLLVILLIIGLSNGLVSAQTESPSHTLTISSNGNGTASYVVTSSSKLSFRSEEPAEYVRGSKQAAGTVGEENDEKDVIKYNGYIESFDYEGDITIHLNGRQVSPDVLTGNHIKIVHPTNASETIEYYYPLNGESARGEYAEEDDSATDMQILGSIDKGVDSFYYRGTIPDHAFQGLAPVFVNGELVDNQGGPQQTTLTKETKQPTPTISSTDTTTESTTTVSTTTNTNTHQTTQQRITKTGTSPTTSSDSQADAPASEQSSSLVRSVTIGLGAGISIVIGLILASIAIDTYLISK